MTKGKLSERLKAVIAHYADGKAKSFSNLIGVPANTLSGYLSPSGESKVRYDLFCLILESCPEISPGWLLAGEGGMFRDSPPATEPKQPEKTQIDRELQDIEDRLLKWGAGPEEVKRAIMAHLGVHAPISLADSGPHAPERDQGRFRVQEPPAAFGAAPADKKNPMKE